MKKQEFQNQLVTFRVGDSIKIEVRGNYGNYLHEGVLTKIENDRIYLDSGKSHSYQRINSIKLTKLRDLP